MSTPNTLTVLVVAYQSEDDGGTDWWLADGSTGLDHLLAEVADHQRNGYTARAYVVKVNVNGFTREADTSSLLRDARRQSITTLLDEHFHADLHDERINKVEVPTDDSPASQALRHVLDWSAYLDGEEEWSMDDNLIPTEQMVALFNRMLRAPLNEGARPVSDFGAPVVTPANHAGFHRRLVIGPSDSVAIHDARFNGHEVTITTDSVDGKGTDEHVFQRTERVLVQD